MGTITDFAALVTEVRAIRHLIDERDRLYQQQLLAAKEAVHLAMGASERAVAKAEAASEKRFESVNEFRAQMGDMQQTFAKQETMDIRFRAIEQKIDDLLDDRALSKGHGRGIADLWGWIIAAVTAIGLYLHWVLTGK